MANSGYESLALTLKQSLKKLEILPKFVLLKIPSKKESKQYINPNSKPPSPSKLKNLMLYHRTQLILFFNPPYSILSTDDDPRQPP
jgi:P pilus assembly chaperone PapD